MIKKILVFSPVLLPILYVLGRAAWFLFVQIRYAHFSAYDRTLSYLWWDLHQHFHVDTGPGLGAVMICIIIGTIAAIIALTTMGESKTGEG